MTWRVHHNWLTCSFLWKYISYSDIPYTNKFILDSYDNKREREKVLDEKRRADLWMLFPSCNKIVVGKVFFEMIISFSYNITCEILVPVYCIASIHCSEGSRTQLYKYIESYFRLNPRVVNNEQDMHVLTKASETTALNSTLYIFFSTDLHTFIKILYIKKKPE